MKAVIMAGGEGTRLRPLTCDMPKPMVRLCGRPVLDYILDLLKLNGFDNIDITVRYLPDVITRYFESGYEGLNLRFVEEDMPLGTAGSVRNAYTYNDDVLIISGDAICDFDLAGAMRFHREQNSDATVIVKKVSDPREYGLVNADENGLIRLFIEKPDYTQALSDLANTGVYILSKSALDLIPRDKPFDFSKDLFPLMLKTGMKLYAHEETGYWCDIGDFHSYRLCQRDMLLNKVQCTLGEGQIKNNSYISNNARVAEDAVIEEFSVIDDGALIGAGVRVTQSIVLKNAIISDKARLTGAIVCSGACIKKKAMLFDSAVIGKNAIVGEKATVMSGVKLWPHKELPIGTVASENIKTSSKRTELFSEEGICGEVGAELTPELASRLGAAIGSLGFNNIVVSATVGSCSDMLKSSLMAGIQSAGAMVIDIGTASQGEFNFALCFVDSQIGVYISSTNETSIEILTQGGLPLTREIERKLEGILLRGEIRRSSNLSIGERVVIREVRGFYHDMLNREVPQGLEGVYAQIKSTSKDIAEEAETLIKSLGARTDSGEIYQISAKGNKVSIYGKDIGYLPYRRVLALCSLIELSQGRDISIPFDAPMAIDTVGEKYGKRVYRYLSCPTTNEDSFERELAKNALWSRDGLMMTLKLLSYLKNEQITLAELLERVPSFGTAVKTIYTEESVGELLRWLQTENKGLIGEGIILSEKRGTVLIKPMKRGTGVKIYAEAMRFETAFELCDDMSFYIKNRRNREKL